MEKSNERATRHSSKRMNGRLGIPLASADRQARLAKDRGMPHGECSGQLRKWVDKKALSYKGAEGGRNYRIYNNSLFIFDGSFELVITVLPVPTNLHTVLSKQLKRYKEKLA